MVVALVADTVEDTLETDFVVDAFVADTLGDTLYTDVVCGRYS